MQEVRNDFQNRLDSFLNAGAERAVGIIDTVLADAEQIGASDVHFEPTLTSLEIKYRIDGVLRVAAWLPNELSPNLIARLKVLANLLTYRTDIPQEGSIRSQESTHAADMRVSTFPTVHGEKAVVRIFQTGQELLHLEQLGLSKEILSALIALLQERTGALLLTGPSGSGKTTTIYACLHRLTQAGGGRHIVTIEDPVERLIPGVTQSQARPGTDFDFARGLRSLLRQDPDAIMVGEIRDRATAAAAIEASLTGHLVFTTLHSGSAAGVVGRLLEMGIEPYLLTSGIKGILNQRLLRRLCVHCQGGGCGKCHNTGYHGRLLIAELLTPNAAFRRAILARSDTDALEEVAAQSGMATIRADAEYLVAWGGTTPDEVQRVLGPAHRSCESSDKS